MGCYDGAEVCELVGTYLLNQLMVVIAKENMELYRHDGVGIFKSVSGIEVEFKTEELVTILKNNGVSITVKTNLEIVYFIDIYFNLVKVNTVNTVNTAATFKLNLRRISEISSNQCIFKQSISIVFLKYTPTQNQDENNQ